MYIYIYIFICMYEYVDLHTCIHLYLYLCVRIWIYHGDVYGIYDGIYDRGSMDGRFLKQTRGMMNSITCS